MENSNKLQDKNIETFTDDLVEAIENDKSGLIKKIIHQEEAEETLKKNLSPESNKNKLFMILGIFLVFLSLAALVFVFLLREKINILSTMSRTAPILFTDQNDFKAIDGFARDRIMETVFGELNGIEVKKNGIKRIFLTENKKTVSFKRFMELIKGNLAVEQHKLISDDFALGLINKEIRPFSTEEPLGVSEKITSKNLFILLKVKSFTDIFPVMRNWENKMLSDLHGFFGVNLSLSTNYLFTKEWQDGIVLNKNARILKSENGETVLMYVFIDDSFVIITDSEAAVREVALRIFSGQIRR